MARSFVANDRLAWFSTLPMGNITGGTTTCSVALRMKTTSVTANVHVNSRWDSGSRNGFGLLLNTTANKLQLAAYNATTLQVNMTGTTTVNNGAWHSVILLLNGTTTTLQSMYVDGVLDASVTSSGAWLTNDVWWVFGTDFNAFWGKPVIDYADAGYWTGRHLSADEIAAYAKGCSASNFRANLTAYAPMAREIRDLRGNALQANSGTTASDHPRVIGSLT